MEALVPFWAWCFKSGIRSPADVHRQVITDYLLTLHGHWRCPSCGETAGLKRRTGKESALCPRCGASEKPEQLREYAQNTFRGVVGRLRMFFDWAKINRRVASNPVGVESPPLHAQSQHYPNEILIELVSYITNSDSDPTVALMLYLNIFHGMSSWELRHSLIPIGVPISTGREAEELAGAYSVIVPKREVSLGRRHQSRAGTCLDFSEAVKGWLEPLLIRFYRQRRGLLGRYDSKYLFAGARNRHGKPLSRSYIVKTISRALERALGFRCNVKTLRKSIGVFAVGRGGPGALHNMGWGLAQGFAYTWLPRETIIPVLRKQPLAPATGRDGLDHPNNS
jgi:hypothetical protein